MGSAVPPTATVKSRRFPTFQYRRNSTSSKNPPSSPPIQSPRLRKGAGKVACAVNGKEAEDVSRWIPSRGELEKVFVKFDGNRDGKISLSELRGLMGSMGQKSMSEEEVGWVMKEADSDGDGFISFDEFYDANTKGVNAMRVMKDLESAFNMYDLDKSGHISAEELHSVLRSLGEKSTLKECHQMIKTVDKNDDGFINFQEFIAMMSTPPNPPT